MSTRKPSATNWARVHSMNDQDIDMSDIPELGASFFKNATLRLPEVKKAVSVATRRSPIKRRRLTVQGRAGMHAGR
jgi:hypothetical protein